MASGLSLSTIYRMWGCTFITTPHFLTIQKLANAVDLNIIIKHNEIYTTLENL